MNGSGAVLGDADAVRRALSEGGRWARCWLFADALPLWSKRGVDRAWGGWFDKLDERAMPVACPKRLRVQARQVFVFAEARRLGWEGPWHEAVDHGLHFMLARFKRPDGLFRASVTREGEPIVDTPDLYDQAFALFALAAGHAALGRPAGLAEEGRRLLDALVRELAHPCRGFEEARPRTLPLRSNPHMHLLEALLAWIEEGAGEPFAAQAHAIVALCHEQLVDRRTGAVGELYDGDWQPYDAGGDLREPGHQFEWAYLLHRADQMLGGDHGLLWDGLHRFGTRTGVRAGLTVAAVTADGTLADGSARLWAQTERLRAMVALAPDLAPEAGNAARAAAVDSLAAVRRFLDVPVPGLWRDRVDRNGAWLDEPTPASTLYHIVTGLAPLIEMRDDGIDAPAGERLEQSI